MEDKPTPTEKPETPPAEEPKRIKLERFMEIDLRVAVVLAAERVENTDKLMKLEIDVGDGHRQILAGVAQAYEPQGLVGKRIIVVANLKPARIRGLESQGMLLAADLGGRPIVATFEEEVPAGTRVR